MKMTNNRKPYFKALSSLLASLVATAPMAPAWGLNWANATMGAGHAAGKTEGGTTTIVQGSQNAIYNWGGTGAGAGFNLGSQETLNLLNGSGSSLMRDTTGMGSSILGKINATGNLMIANPAGILIGKDSVLDIGGQFHAVAGDVAAWDGGDYTATIGKGVVRNEGAIQAGGKVSLLGAQVLNYGTVASADTIAIGAAANAAVPVTVATAKGGAISFTFENAEAGEIHNHGTIQHKAYSANTVLNEAVGNLTGSDTSENKLWEQGLKLYSQTVDADGQITSSTYNNQYNPNSYTYDIEADGDLYNRQGYAWTDAEGASHYEPNDLFILNRAITSTAQGIDENATVTLQTAGDVNGHVNLHSGVIAAQNLTIETAELADAKEGTDQGHSITVAKDLSLQAGQIDLTNTKIDARGNERGSIVALQDVKLGNIQYSGDVRAMGGDILIRKATEDVVVNAATAAGNIEINSAGKVTANGMLSAADVAVTATDDVTVRGATARAGNVTLISTKGDLTNGGNVTAAGEKATLKATDGNIVKTGNVKAGKEIEIATKGDVFINGVIETEEKAADSGKVTITATEGAIYDTWARADDIEIKTGDLILSAGDFIGNSASETAPALNDMLKVEVETLDATAKNGIQIEEQDALDVKNAINSGVGDVKVTTGGAMTLVKESEVSAHEGDVVLTAAGSLHADERATVTAQKNALLLSGSDLTLDRARVEAQQNVRMVNQTGTMMLDAATVRAGEVVNMGGENDGTTIDMKASTVTAANGDVAVYAQSNITMDRNSVLESEAADVAMKSGAGDVTVGQVVAEEGRAAIQAGGNIVRADGSTTDNVTAREVLLVAVDGTIGKQETDDFTHYIHVNATDLQAASGKSLYLNATKALTVKDLATETKIDLVDGNGTVTKDVAQPFAGDHALKAGEDIRLNVAATLTKVEGAPVGDETVTLVVADKVEAGMSDAATGTIRIETESGSIVQNAEIAADGDITIVAQEDLRQNANIRTTEKGDVVSQTGRDHVMAAGTVIAADGDVPNSEKGSVLVDAGRDFHLEKIEADNHVAVQAGRDVIDIDRDAVVFNDKGEATNLNAADQKADIIVRNDRNLVINAGGDIGAAGEMNGATDGIDIAVNGKVSAQAGGSLALTQTANDTVGTGDLNIGDVAAFRVEQVEFSAAGGGFATTDEQVGITAGGTANLAAENWIVNDNASATETAEITAEKLVLTAGKGAGVNRAHEEDSLQVEVTGAGANAIWGNSTTASDRSVTMSMEDAAGNRELFADGGAMEESGVVLLMDGRYHGGDNLYYNHFAQIHGLNQNRLPGAVSDLNIFNDSTFIYADRDVADVPGAKFRTGVRPAAHVKMTKTGSASGETTTTEPFVGSYNPEKAVADDAREP